MKKIIIILSTLFFLSAMSANAQVVLGNPGADTPSKGAILDLQSNGSYGGLLLPKVMLTSITKWAPLGTSQASATNGTMVYNISEVTNNGLTGNGVYVWEGGTTGQWKLITSEYGVVVPVHVISVYPASVNFNVRGQSITLMAIANPINATDQSATWVSNNPAVATVDLNTGLVKAVFNGTATITATSINGKTATCTINVSGIPDL